MSNKKAKREREKEGGWREREKGGWRKGENGG